MFNKCPNSALNMKSDMEWFAGDEIITKGEKILAVKYSKLNRTSLNRTKLVEEKWNIIHDDLLGQTWNKGEKSSVGYFTFTSKKYGVFLTATTTPTSDLDVQGNVTISLFKCSLIDILCIMFYVVIIANFLKLIFHLVVGNGDLTKGSLFWIVYSIALALGIVFLLRELGQCFSVKKIKNCRSYFQFDNIFELVIILMTIWFLILILVVDDRGSKKFVGGLALLFGKLLLT